LTYLQSLVTKGRLYSAQEIVTQGRILSGSALTLFPLTIFADLIVCLTETADLLLSKEPLAVDIIANPISKNHILELGDPTLFHTLVANPIITADIGGNNLISVDITAIEIDQTGSRSDDLIEATLTLSSVLNVDLLANTTIPKNLVATKGLSRDITLEIN